MKTKQTVLIGHSYFGRGGAESAAMWLIESIKNDFDVHLLTRGGWDLNELNALSGTNVKAKEITLVKFPLRKFSGTNKYFGLLWDSYFGRICRVKAPQYNLVITASSTINWGTKAIHFLTDIVWNSELNAQFNYNSAKSRSNLYSIYFALAQFIKGKTNWDIRKNDIFVANSEFTANLSNPYVTNQSIVIYPVVPSNFKTIPWEKRKNEFICFGRVSPEKKIEDAISIIQKVRENGHYIELTIIGEFDQSDYSIKIQELANRKTWINTPGPIYGESKYKILPNFRYGINCCTREAFGISTAEMMKAGIVPFTPIQGAQKEITECAQITFDGIDDAVKKISAILESTDLQTEICTHLNSRKHLFSAQEYKNNVLNLLSNL